MNKLTKEQFIEIRRWVYRNARPLDIARWRYHFENGGKDDVLNALAAYQNEDGGFGNALEADSWNPASSPITAATAVDILEEIKFRDKKHPIIISLLRYLEDTPDFNGSYWPALIPSNNDYPHAPWWTLRENIKEEWGYNPTAKLAGFILRFAGKDSTIYEKARKIATEAVTKYLSGVTWDNKSYRSVFREGEITCYHYLLMSLKEEGIAEASSLSDLEKALKEQTCQFIDRDPSTWNQYCRKPSMFIDSPDSVFCDGNEAPISEELDFLLSRINKDGVWDITWDWGAYEKEFAISKNWWKSNFAILNLLLLKNFNRIV